MIDIRPSAQGVLFGDSRLTYECLIQLNDGVQTLESQVSALASSTSSSSTTTSGSYYVATYAATFTPQFANGSAQQITLTGNISIVAPSDSGFSLEFFLVQDATGGRTITFAAAYFGIPNDFILLANTYTWIRFVQRADGKLACTAMLSAQPWP